MSSEIAGGHTGEEGARLPQSPPWQRKLPLLLDSPRHGKAVNLDQILAWA